MSQIRLPLREQVPLFTVNNRAKFAPGDRVGADFREPHGHRGTVLDACDPKAWVGTIAFAHQGDNPDPAEVRAHVARQRERNMGFDNCIPVAWDFGRVYWERVESLFKA